MGRHKTGTGVSVPTPHVSVPKPTATSKPAASPQAQPAQKPPAQPVAGKHHAKAPKATKAHHAAKHSGHHKKG